MSQVVDFIFHKFALTYGREFLSKFDGVDEHAVKADWANELGWFLQPGREQVCRTAMLFALDNLPPRSPNVIEFRELMRRAPAPAVKALPLPAVNRAVMTRVVAAMGGGKAPPVRDRLTWARELVARHERGEPVLPHSLRTARAALGLSVSARARA